MAPEHILISGARVNNLKEVSCQIPHEQLTVITGPSGSGKSSLAFDTLYAEGQRRYIESMSAYARQFLDRIEKPDVDKIQHVLPAIALEQKNSINNARSTVGTSTEIYDYLRILFSTIGKNRCDECGSDVTQTNPSTVQQYLEGLEEGSKILILAPVPLVQININTLIEEGYFRVFHQNEIQELKELRGEFNKADTLKIVIDRLIIRKEKKLGNRLLESIKNALNLSNGQIEIRDLAQEKTHRFQTDFACTNCNKVFTRLDDPNQFSFNSPLGACTTCEGFGRIIGMDYDKIIPNKTLSLKEGAVHPFQTPSNQEIQELLESEAKKKKIRLTVPYEELKEKEKAFIIEGSGEYPGIRKFFDWLESKKYKVHVRVMLAKYRGYYQCHDCQGARIQKTAQQVHVNNKTLWDLSNLPIETLSEFFENLELSDIEAHLSQRLLREIMHRINYLKEVGLDYLTLARQSRTLSGGEAQRINLSTALGSALTDTLYVLDEPTVGLHARDTHQLLLVLKALRDHGNTLVVVEHDPELIEGADYIIDIGPKGGEEGGRIVYEGPTSGIYNSKTSITGESLRKRNEKLKKKKPSQSKPLTINPLKPGKGNAIEIVGAYGNNLKNITVQLPKNQLVCVTGVSGSGKSTLIQQTLYLGYQHERGKELNLEGQPFLSLSGLEEFEDVILVDQSPPGRSARSNPVTYLKAYDEIRNLFAQSRKAQVLGLKPTHFSFNTPGGRCETCEGMGTITIDMQFMADVTVICKDCKGRRFNPEVLSIDLFEKNIDDVLNMTVNEAMQFFKTAAKVRSRLKPLQDIGLGYLRLGQSTATLSGGEAQRLKLASYLKEGERKQGCYLFLFDEPTTGLHLCDIDLLVEVMRRLIESRHSLIVVEHNLDFVAQADYIIDLGPEGGEKGGQIVAAGTVKEIMECPQSQTGKFLKASKN